MTDKERLIADLIVSAIKAGFKVTFEGPTIGAESRGVHMHATYVDELLDELGPVNPWDYIDKKLNNQTNNTTEEESK